MVARQVKWVASQARGPKFKAQNPYEKVRDAGDLIILGLRRCTWADSEGLPANPAYSLSFRPVRDTFSKAYKCADVYKHTHICTHAYARTLTYVHADTHGTHGTHTPTPALTVAL